MQKRTTCRKRYIALRNELSQEAVKAKSAVICEKILESPEYNEAQIILAYYPLGNEVNCLPVLADALKKEKRVMLPRTEKDCQMDFYEIHSFSDVEEGTFHVMEPKDYCSKFKDCDMALSADSIRQNVLPGSEVLVLVPGVVFDRQGNRYGYGKGYYDRYFARYPQFNRIALAYTEQVSAESLECLETDVKMHVIVTDDETIRTDESF